MNENDNRFLVYKIGNDLYGSPLLSVREVLEYQKPKFMPNMVSYFSGVINVRGGIVGVIDMRSKFNFKGEVTRKTAMLLCDTERGPIAAIVGSVESVLEIQESDLEKEPPVKTKMKSKYLIGIAKNNENLITIINLHQSLVEEEFKAA